MTVLLRLLALVIFTPLVFSRPLALPSLNSALESGAKEITVIAQFKTPSYKVGGNETAAQIQKRKMQAASQAQASFLSSMQTRLNKVGDIKDIKSLWINNSVILTGSKELISDLQKRDDLVSLIPDREIHLEKPAKVTGPTPKDGEEYTYGLEMIRAPQVWKTLGIDGKGITVGLLDTGWADHPELEGRVLQSKDFVSDYADNQPNDGHGHGSHCLGTIGGGNLSGKSIGVAPKVKFIVGKIFSDSGSTTLAKIMDAMQWIADPDGNPETADYPRVVSNSWGGGKSSMAEEKPMWDIVTTWRELGIVPVFAAGNSGPSSNTVGTPGGYPHAFAIGATGGQDQIASFSSRGPITWEDKDYVKPEVSAPGVNIYSLRKGSGYTGMSGTSMATPHVAGVVALMLQANPELTVSEIETILRETSIDLGDAGMDNDFGQGRVDAFSAVAIAVSGGKLAMNISAGDFEASIKITPGDQTYKTKDGAIEVILPSGTYEAEVRAFGFVTQRHSIVIKKNKTTSTSVSLQEGNWHNVAFWVSTPENTALNGKISFVDIPVEGGAVINGLFQTRMPVGTYTAKIFSRGYRSFILQFDVKSDSTQAVHMIKLPPLLLVDDDQGKNYETYYKASLIQNGVDFDAVGSIGSEELMGYETVLWFTGDDSSSSVLNDKEQKMLTKYVESGGRLITSGQDLGYGIKFHRFYSKVLGAHYLADTSPVKKIKGQGIEFELDGEDSAGNQKYPEVFRISNSAKDTASALFNYDRETDQGTFLPAGIINSYGEGKAIYLGFGFEGISGYQKRNAVMKALLDNVKTNAVDKLKRIAWAYENDRELYPVLVNLFVLKETNQAEVRRYLSQTKTKQAFRTVLNDLKELEE